MINQLEAPHIVEQEGDSYNFGFLVFECIRFHIPDHLMS
jgi:hypothetical protein